MKILVTSGTALIGPAVIRNIISNIDDSIVNVDKRTYAGNLESLTSVSDSARYAFEQVDICNRVVLDGVLQRQQPNSPMPSCI